MTPPDEASADAPSPATDIEGWIDWVEQTWASSAFELETTGVSERWRDEPRLHSARPQRVAVTLSRRRGRRQFALDDDARDASRRWVLTHAPEGLSDAAVDRLARDALGERAVKIAITKRSSPPRRVELVGLDELERVRDQGRGAVIAAPHLGPVFSLVELLASRLGRVYCPITRAPWQRRVIRDAAGVLRYRAELRAERAGVRLVGGGDSFVGLLELLRRGAVVVVMFDALGTRITRIVGRDYALTSGPSELAFAAEVPVFPAYVVRHGSSLRAELLPHLEPRREWTPVDLQARIAASLEPVIAANLTQLYPHWMPTEETLKAQRAKVRARQAKQRRARAKPQHGDDRGKESTVNEAPRARPSRSGLVALEARAVSKLRPRGVVGEAVEDWALKDLSFWVARADVFGIIAPDPGAIDPVLRVLCGLSAPTAGAVVINGWMAPPVRQVMGSLDLERTVAGNLAAIAPLVRAPRRITPEGLVRITRFAGVPGTDDFELGELPAPAAARLVFATLLELKPDVMLCMNDPLPGDAVAHDRAWAAVERERRDGMSVVIVTQTQKALVNCASAAWIDAGCVRKVGATAAIVRELDSLPSRPRLDPAPEEEIESPRADHEAVLLVDVRIQPMTGPACRIELDVAEPARVLLGLNIRHPDGSVSRLRQPAVASLAPGRVSTHVDLSAVALAPGRHEIAAEARWTVAEGEKQRSSLRAKEPLIVAVERPARSDGVPVWR